MAETAVNLFPTYKQPSEDVGVEALSQFYGTVGERIQRTAITIGDVIGSTAEVLPSINNRAAVGVLSAVALGASVYLASSEPATPIVRGNISEFRDGVLSPTDPSKTNRINMVNVSDPRDIIRKVRLLYLDRCIWSETQNQFNTDLKGRVNRTNDNKTYLKVLSLTQTNNLAHQLEAARIVGRMNGTFRIDYGGCTMPPWIPYVRFEADGEEKLKRDIKDSGCDGVSEDKMSDLLWRFNPQKRDSGGETIVPSLFNGSVYIPTCRRVDQRNTDAIPRIGPYIRIITPGQMKPINKYRTAEFTPTRVSRDLQPEIQVNDVFQNPELALAD